MFHTFLFKSVDQLSPDSLAMNIASHKKTLQLIFSSSQYANNNVVHLGDQYNGCFDYVGNRLLM